MGRALAPSLDVWPRRDYIALLEEEEKRRSNEQRCFSAARGRPQRLFPGVRAGAQGREHAPAPGARQHTARQYKTIRTTTERSDLRGVGGHAAPALHASPRLYRVRHVCAPPVPRHAQGQRPRSASRKATEGLALT